MHIKFMQKCSLVSIYYSIRTLYSFTDVGDISKIECCELTISLVNEYQVLNTLVKWAPVHWRIFTLQMIEWAQKDMKWEFLIDGLLTGKDMETTKTPQQYDLTTLDAVLGLD